ncbi:MAG: N6-L-threonylcarbamoyladenine synthase [Candidatus Paceibacteria bacterium]|jgi:N6-L-threonylcarbamoyladenine synthase
MKILGIETSCDETALSLIEAEGEKTSLSFKILNTALNSQIELHREYGGVYPTLAKREHARNLVPLLDSLIEGTEETNNIDWDVIQNILEREPELFEIFKEYIETHKKPDVDLIAVTYGPGLEPALWVGINFAKALSTAWNIPLVPVNHMEGHMVSALLNTEVKDFPAVSLLISGGHTEIIRISNWGEYNLLGQTVDDAVGEAYDKVARMIGLPYPGGPEISKLAKEGRDEKLMDGNITLPRPMLHTKDLNFSFSGLKTAVLYTIKKIGELDETKKKIIAKEFEQAVVDILMKKTIKALEESNSTTLIVGGGVIANDYIRENLKTLGNVYFPEKDLSTDNGVMIAMAGYLNKEKGEINPEIKAEGNLKF